MLNLIFSIITIFYLILSFFTFYSIFFTSPPSKFNSYHFNLMNDWENSFIHSVFSPLVVPCLWPPRGAPSLGIWSVFSASSWLLHGINETDVSVCRTKHHFAIVLLEEMESSNVDDLSIINIPILIRQQASVIKPT